MDLQTYLALIDLLSLLPAIGVGYYAFRMVFMTRLGRLEKGWKLIAIAGMLLSTGFVFIAMQDLFEEDLRFYVVADNFGAMFVALGLLFLTLGFRSHYSVWSLESFSKTIKERKKKIQATEIENGK